MNCQCGCGGAPKAGDRFLPWHHLKNRKSATMIDRAWRYISPEPMSGCWLWMGCLNKGYGMITSSKRPKRAVAVHRLMYEAERGPIPEGLQLDHLCRVRCCVNPTHLEPVTATENRARGMSFAAVHARKTHCIHGHELTGSNLVIPMWDGKPYGRRCRTCANARGLRKLCSRGHSMDLYAVKCGKRRLCTECARLGFYGPKSTLSN